MLTLKSFQRFWLWYGLCILTNIAQAELPIDGVQGGTISNPGDEVIHTFTAAIGESIQLSLVGELNLDAIVYYPDGSILRNDSFANQIALGTLAQTGVYSVSITASNSNETGNYEIYFTKVPGANEHGLLDNGGVHNQFLSSGDLDTFTFNVTAGESVQLSLASEINLDLYVYRPDGSVLLVDFFANQVDLRELGESGTYTVLIRSGNVFEAGSYELYYVRAPGANEHGLLDNDGVHSEHLSAGDLDTYTFAVEAGESVQLSIVGTINLDLFVYYPDGSVRLADGFANQIELRELTETGTYTVLIRSATVLQVGDYDLYYVKAPGANEHGLLSDDDYKSEHIDSGELDTYTFSATEGDSLQFSIASEILLDLYVYSPDGSLLRGQGYARQVEIWELPQSGTYTVVVRSAAAWESGDYDLYYVKAPGASEFGDLGSDFSLSKNLGSGDLDSFKFFAAAGESIQFSFDSEIAIHITIYDPDGSLRWWDASANQIELRSLPDTGSYTVVIRSATVSETGDYSLYFVKAPGASEHGSLNINPYRAETINPGDLDSYTFTVAADGMFTLSVAGNIDVDVAVYAPDGFLLLLDLSAGEITRNNLPSTGKYTVVIRSAHFSDSGNYTLNFDSDAEIATYVALGDSYSAGTGAGKYITDGLNANVSNTCHRSERAYTLIGDIEGSVSQTGGIENGFYRFFRACHGAKTSHMISEQWGGRTGSDIQPEPPQLSNPEIIEADLITLSIGGNDVGFSSVLKGSILEQNWHTNTISSDLKPLVLEDPRFGLTQEERELLENRTNSYNVSVLAERLTPLLYEVVDKIREKRVLAGRNANPKYGIHLMGYPRIFPDPDNYNGLQKFYLEACLDPNWPGYNGITEGEIEYINLMADNLANVMSSVALNKGICYSDVRSKFTGYEACTQENVPPRLSPEPYINSIDAYDGGEIGSLSNKFQETGESFHPNKLGHEAYAKALEESISNCGYTNSSAASSVASENLSTTSFAESASTADINFDRRELKVLAAENLIPSVSIAIDAEGFAPTSTVVLYYRDFRDGDLIEIAEFQTDSAGAIQFSFVNPVLPVDMSVAAREFKLIGRAANGDLLILENNVSVAENFVDSDGNGIPDLIESSNGESVRQVQTIPMESLVILFSIVIILGFVYSRKTRV